MLKNGQILHLKALGLQKAPRLIWRLHMEIWQPAWAGQPERPQNLESNLLAERRICPVIKNISIDVANTGMQAVFTGETESLKKLGVVMTEANLKSYMLANGYKKTYEELTQWEKVQLRAKFVMDATNNSAGDFARTSEGAANQSRMFKEGLKELGATFGDEIVPAITPVIKGINGMFKSFGDLDSNTKKTIVTVAAVAAALGPIALGAGKVVSGVGGAVKIINSLKTASAASAVATAAAATAETAAGTAAAVAAPAVTGFGTALKAAAGPIGLALIAIGALATHYMSAAGKIQDAQQKIIDSKYDKLASASDAHYQKELDNLEKDKTALSDNLAKKEEKNK